jgi:hypothetical protein
MAADSMVALLQEWIDDRKRFFKRAFLALKVSEITGDDVEFGSWGGQSLKAAYEVTKVVAPDRHLWAFDPSPLTREAHPQRMSTTSQGTTASRSPRGSPCR